MNYGFVIDNRTCIGCHACSTACKAENRVPLGVYRTWVKYVEKGAFPNTRRHFQVTRCNHCANPPCVRICPVTAMYQRADGIVEFDPRVCIGCKACMQGCPYDAIYLDPDTHTAAKCHYCSHRTDLGLEPACVVVCPTQSIITGDLDDPGSKISRLVAREKVSVRRPEQGTVPKLFYIDGDEVTLTPTATQLGSSFMWADVIPLQAAHPDQRPEMQHETHNTQHTTRTTPSTSRTSYSGTSIRTPTAQGAVEWGPIYISESRLAEHMVQTGYNAQHKIPWHWPVPAYLVTKGVGSGVFALLALFFGLDLVNFSRPLAVWGNFIALLFIGLTTLLLVIDLDKPARFYTIMTRPQWQSWLTRGAFILIGFTAVAGLWLLLEGAVLLRLVPFPLVNLVRPVFLWVGFGLALASAVYTAFLFGQAEGRDLWQSSLLPFHLLVQAVMAGAGVLLLLGFFVPMPRPMVIGLTWIFGGTLALDLFITLFGEFGMPHASEVAARAAHDIRAGHYRHHFWWGSLGLGHLLPLIILLVSAFLGSLAFIPLIVAVLATLTGLYLFEYAFVMAPQQIPNS
jgi:Fe-S-cluster-containing dehydrogenase component/formate-dependent nitrite reductase membrane component NrfD